MKAIKTILGALAVASLLSVSAFAQENGNRDENGNVVRGPYVTNGFGDNWFIGVGAMYNAPASLGLPSNSNLTTKDYFKSELFKLPAQHIGVDAFIGKWFTPCVGARVGYRGFQNVFNATENTLLGYGSKDKKYKEHIIHADFMWNLSNAIGGYKETRFWDIIPYIQTAYVNKGNEGFKKNDHELGLGVGVFNDFRLGERVDLFLDFSALGIRAASFGYTPNPDKLFSRVAVLPSASLGVMVKLGRTNWDRLSSVLPVVVPGPSQSEYDALANRLAALQGENDNLKNQINDLKNKGNAVDTVYVEKEGASDSGVYTYFDLGSSKLSSREKYHLDYYVENNDLANKTLKVVGSADAATGSAAVNQKLSEARAKAVKDYLVNKGVSADNIATEALGGIAGSADARRVVTTIQ